MKEFKVGQRVWTIQLGDCEVVDLQDGYIVKGNLTHFHYTIDGKFEASEFYRSLFLSNPFERSVDTNETIEPKLVRQQNDGWVENKVELINALVSVINCEVIIGRLRIIAEDKLQKLLKSL